MSTRQIATHGITVIRAVLLIVGLILLFIFLPKSASGAGDIEAVGGKPVQSLFAATGLNLFANLQVSQNTPAYMAKKASLESSATPTVSAPRHTSTTATAHGRSTGDDHPAPAPPKTTLPPQTTAPTSADSIAIPDAGPQTQKIQPPALKPVIDTTRSTVDRLLYIPQMMF